MILWKDLKMMILMTVIWLTTLILFKVMDWFADWLVAKTSFRKNGIKPFHKVRYLVSLIFGNTKEVSGEVFDDFCIQWGVSRDLLLFKKEIGTLSRKEETFLSKWEKVWKGKRPKNSEELYEESNDKNVDEGLL